MKGKLITLIIVLSFGVRMVAQEKINISIDIKNGVLNTIMYPLNNAETIILLHGGPGVPNQMEQIVKLFNKKYEVIYFEQRGTGNSYCPNCSYTMEDYISDINAITEHYNLDAFHLFGHSWGGLYAQVYADKNSQKIKSLFLCSPSSGTNKTWKETEKEVMNYNKKMTSSGEWLKMGWNSLLGIFGSDKAYRRLFEQVYKNYHRDFQDIKINEEELTGIFAEPINKTRKEIINYKSLKKVENPPFPICISYGDHDIYGESTIKLIERFPTARVYEIKDCGHIPWLHNILAFEKIVAKFYEL